MWRDSSITVEEAAQQVADQTEEHGQVQPGDEQGQSGLPGGEQVGPAQGVHRQGGEG